MIAIFSCSTAAFGQELTWITDFEEAKEKAKEQEKLILIRFTGSDWCANCVRLDTALIERPEFAGLARSKFVLLYLDFPSKEENALSLKQQDHNQKLMEQFNPTRAFPAILILDEKGKVLGQMSVRPNTTAGYVELLKEIIGS